MTLKLVTFLGQLIISLFGMILLALVLKPVLEALIVLMAK